MTADTDPDALAERRSERRDLVGSLAGGFAHDLNNLLAVIRTHAEILKADLRDPEQRIDADAILGACMRAVGLTQQLLVVGRRRSQTIKAVDLNATIEETTPLLQRLAGKTVRVQTLLGSARPRAEVDVTRIQQVLMDLVLDARDALPAGGSIAIETSDVTVEGTRYLRVSVSDDALAPTPAERMRAFVPFFATARERDETGLGLAPMRAIVEGHRGRLRVAGAEPRGTRFEIDLPSVEP